MADSNFIDYVKIFCASGHGGAGSTHLHRAKYIPKGGPDGGDGGRGGHIILRANPQLWTLIHLKYRKHVRAEDGGKGGKKGVAFHGGRSIVGKGRFASVRAPILAEPPPRGNAVARNADFW